MDAREVHARFEELKAREERKHREHLARLRGTGPAGDATAPLCVNLYALTGRKRLPRALGATNPERYPVASLCAAYGDPWVHPGSGGLFGPEQIRTATSNDFPDGLPLSPGRLEHTLLREPWVPRVGGLIAMNIRSRDGWATKHLTETRAAYLQNLGILMKNAR